MTTGKLIVLRHGQTKDNLKGILSGQNETSLSTLGEKQAHHAGYLIYDIPLSKVYSSSLSRAFNTASLALQSAGQAHLGVEKRVELVETDLGKFTGMHVTSDAYATFNFKYDRPLPGGESTKDVVDRVGHFYEDEILPRLARGENVMVVAPAGVVSAFSILLGARDPKQPRRDVANATPVVYEYEDGVLHNSYLIENPVSVHRPKRKTANATRAL